MASLGLQTRCAKYLSSVVLNAPSNFWNSDIDFMFTNRYNTHENTLHTPRHQDSTKRDSKTTCTVPKKKVWNWRSIERFGFCMQQLVQGSIWSVMLVFALRFQNHNRVCTMYKAESLQSQFLVGQIAQRLCSKSQNYSGHRQERTQISTYTNEVVGLADWQTVLHCVLRNSVTRARSATEGIGYPKCVRAISRSLLSAFGLTKYPTLSTSTIFFPPAIKWMQCEADKSICWWQQECVQLHIRALFTRLRRSVSSQGRQHF
jgi:hypothetical protein